MIIDTPRPAQPYYVDDGLSAAEREALLAEKKRAVRRAQLDAIARDSGAAVAAAIAADDAPGLDAPDYTAAQRVLDTLYSDLQAALDKAYEGIEDAGYLTDEDADEDFTPKLADGRDYNGRDHEFWDAWSEALGGAHVAMSDLEYAQSRLTQAAGLRREDSQ